MMIIIHILTGEPQSLLSSLLNVQEHVSAVLLIVQQSTDILNQHESPASRLKLFGFGQITTNNSIGTPQSNMISQFRAALGAACRST